ncbi:MAG: hypothetical protein NT027_13700 [Proteobacteria bacterium]|nr:hypothetical protein [Pseudomonadota bacterium]
METNEVRSTEKNRLNFSAIASMAAFLSIMLFTLPALAGTFVGNGGTSSDLDMQILRVKIRDALNSTGENSNKLCKCSENLSALGVCQVVRSLNESQTSLCASTLKSMGPSLAKIIDLDSDLKLKWSEDVNLISREEGEQRDVDAVTIRDHNTIYIKRDHFYSLSEQQQIVLLTHELFHLRPVKKVYVSDRRAFESFPNGAMFLNSLGAATALLIQEQGVDEAVGDLAFVSRSSHRFYLQANLIKVVMHSKDYARKLVLQETGGEFDFLFMYRIKNIGLHIASYYQGTQADSHGVSFQEKMYFGGIGMSYEMTPFSLNLSRWNEMILSLGVEGLFGQTHYEIKDNELEMSDLGQIRGTQVNVVGKYPLNNGLWINGQIQGRQLQYRYNNFGLSINNTQMILGLGVGYGF